MKLIVADPTKVTEVLFNILRIEDIYMFRALLTHPQEFHSTLGAAN
jgi:hypothetical protein